MATQAVEPAGPEFYILRHSERLDEIDPQLFLSSLQNDQSRRNKYSVENDTPITATGVDMAADAARTLKALVLSRYPTGTSIDELPITLYCSKLTRCMQTAYQVARELNRPIFASSGLAMTALAVKKRPFTFLDMPSLGNLCNGVQVHCCDAPEHERHVPVDNWLRAILQVARRPGINIIVAHRETIRNLSINIRLPYCAIGTFRLTGRGTVGTGSESDEVAKELVQPVRIADKDGVRIEDWELVDDVNTTDGQASTVGDDW
ncbi:hypothetical protein B484DRAFT_446955 [Ochromonadaceae sp. CCMP2298]|nr:hypothetical protein B484DRAFT_446955 [Ochromonadaceae sp. CCMP2298]